MSKLPNEDLDSYIIKLKALRGNAFEDEVVSLFGSNYPDFQPVNTLPRGDGGSDGLYEKRTLSLCCYGLNEVEIQYTPAKIKKAIVNKFTSDFMRLLELTSSGRGTGKVYSHNENVALYGILGDDVKINHLKLVCNWNEDNNLIGELNTILKNLISKSHCQFIDTDCDCSFLGPKDVVSICTPTLKHYTRLRYPEVISIISRLDDFTLDGDDPDKSELDLKFEDLETRFAKGNDAKSNKISEFKHRTENEWIEDIIFKQELGKSAPNILISLNEIKSSVVKGLDLSFLGEEHPPLSKIQTCKESFKSKLKSEFHLWDDNTIERITNIMVAGLIGECPLDWRKSG